MAEYQKSVPYDSLPEERKDVVKLFVNNTADNILSMTREQRESMFKICYEKLEPELASISVEEFDCESYDEFLYQMALSAAAVDKRFSFAERRAVDEIRKMLGLVRQPYAKDIVKENIENVKNVKLNLIDVSKMLKPESRGLFCTFTALIFLGDKELAEDEFDIMLHIAAP